MEGLVDSRLIVTCVRNPFDPLRSREIKEAEAGLSIREAIGLFDDLSHDYDYSVAVNGILLPDDFDLNTQPSGSLVFCAVPKGGGGKGGKNPFQVIAAIAIVVVATYLSQPQSGIYAAEGLLGVEAAAYSSYIGVGFAMTAGLLMSAVFSAGDYNGGLFGQGAEKSATYGWDTKGNTNREGVVWPVVYGECRITPPILSKYLTVEDDNQILFLLYALADHDLYSVSSVRINGTLVADGVDGIDYEAYIGSKLNKVPLFFNNNQTLKTVGSQLGTHPVWSSTTPYSLYDLVSHQHAGDEHGESYIALQASTGKEPGTLAGQNYWEVTDAPWTTVDLEGDSVEGFQVAISCPKGLFVAQEDGSYGLCTTSVDIEYGKVVNGSVNTWTPAEYFYTAGTTVVMDRWSAGYWSKFGWEEIVEGSTNRYDHAEGDPYYSDTWLTEVQNTIGGFQIINNRRSDNQWRWVTDGEYVLKQNANLPYAQIQAKQTSPVRRLLYSGRFAPSEFGPYRIRVRYSSMYLPSTSNRYFSETWLDFVTTILYDDFSYPGTAKLELKAQATNKLSGGLPAVDCLVNRFTVNVFDPDDNHEMKVHASNPAWACYDILHNAEYGGNIPHTRIDYDAFAAWASFCASNSLTCGIYFDTPFTVRRALDMLGVLGRGHVVQLGSMFTVFIDDVVTAPTQMFNVANIAKDSFSIEYLPMDERPNSIEVTFWDSTNFDTKTTFAINSSSYDSSTTDTKAMQLSLVGCRTREQALKLGYFALYSAQLLTTTTSWIADVDAIGCLPWDVVDVQHDVTYWGEGGRVVSVNEALDSIAIDKHITLSPGVDYTLKLVDADDDTVAEYTLVSPEHSESVESVTITGTFDPAPEKYDLWFVTATGNETKPMRITKISRNDDFTRRISAIEYNEEVYAAPGTAVFPDPPAPLVYTTNVLATEIATWKGNNTTEIQLSWSGYAMRWWVWSRTEQSDLTTAGSFIVGRTYRIVSIGSTDFTAIGAASNTVLEEFVATGVGSGTGTANQLTFGPWDSQGEALESRFTPKNLSYGNSYNFCVSHTRSLDDAVIAVSARNTENTNVLYDGVIDTTENAPTNFTATLTDQGLELTWDASDEVTIKGYKIGYNTDGGTNYTTLVDNYIGTRYSFKGSMAADLYFRINGITYGGHSSAYAEYHYDLPVPANVGTITTEVFEDGATFKWAPNTDYFLAGYKFKTRVDYDDNNDGNYTEGSWDENWTSTVKNTVTRNLTNAEQRNQGWGVSKIYIKVEAYDIVGQVSASETTANDVTQNKRVSVSVGTTSTLGTFDDLESAIAKLPSGGGAIVIKNGIYQLSAPIYPPNVNLEIIGESMGGVILKNAPSMDFFVIENRDKIYSFSQFSLESQNTNAFSRGITVTGTTDDDNTASVSVSSVKMSLVNNGIFQGGEGDVGFTIEKGKNGIYRFANNDISGGRNGIETSYTGSGIIVTMKDNKIDALQIAIVAGGNDLSILNNTLSSAMYPVFVISSGNAIMTDNTISVHDVYGFAAQYMCWIYAADISIKGNTLRGTRAGLSVSGDAVTGDVTGNTFLCEGLNSGSISQDNSILAIGGSGLSVASNSILYSVTSGSGSLYGIIVYGDNNVISNNSINGTSVAATNFGIYLHSMSADNNGSGNNIWNVGTYIKNSGTRNKINVSGGATF